MLPGNCIIIVKTLTNGGSDLDENNDIGDDEVPVKDGQDGRVKMGHQVLKSIFVFKFKILNWKF